MFTKLTGEAYRNALLGLVLTGFLALPQKGRAADLFATLEESSSGSFRAPNDQLVLTLKEVPSDELFRGLQFELDYIDIGSMLALSGQQLVYQPVGALSYGEHELRILRYSDNGNVNEIGYWRFEVRQSQYFQQAMLNGQLSLSLNQLLAESNTQAEDFSADSSGNLQAALLNEGYSINSRADLFAVDDKTRSPTGKAFDMTTYLIQIQRDSNNLALGHQSYGAVSLLQDGFQKRGLLLQKGISTINSAVSLFSYSSADRVGFDSALGINDGDSRITGGSVNYQALQSSNSSLLISSSYLYGRKENPSFFSITPQVNEGDASNLVVDTSFWQRQLRMRAEVAQSRYDIDGRVFGYDAFRDNAWSTSLLFSPPVDTTSPFPATYSIGFEVFDVGTNFLSIANPNLPRDRHLQRLFGQFAKAGFNLDIGAEREHNNLDNLSFLATTDTDSWHANGIYTLQNSEPDSWRRWLGQQATVNVNIAESNVEDSYTPLGQVANDLKSTNYGASLNVFNTGWGWSIARQDQKIIDYSDQQVDTQTRLIDARLQLFLSPRWSFSPGWQWQQVKTLDAGTVADTKNFSLALQAVLIADKLSTSLNWGLNQNDAHNDLYFATDNSSAMLSGTINWTIRQPKQQTLGYDLSLVFSQQKLTDKLNSSNDTNLKQIFLNFRTTLPFSVPKGVQ